MADTDACENTDRELWRERDGDAYADSIHVTKDGGIGMNVGGLVIVMPIFEWHARATGATRVSALRPSRGEGEGRERGEWNAYWKGWNDACDAYLGMSGWTAALRELKARAVRALSASPPSPKAAKEGET